MLQNQYLQAHRHKIERLRYVNHLQDTFSEELFSNCFSKANSNTIITNSGKCDTKKSRPFMMIILLIFSLNFIARSISCIFPSAKSRFLRSIFWLLKRFSPTSMHTLINKNTILMRIFLIIFTAVNKLHWILNDPCFSLYWSCNEQKLTP